MVKARKTEPHKCNDFCVGYHSMIITATSFMMITTKLSLVTICSDCITDDNDWFAMIMILSRDFSDFCSCDRCVISFLSCVVLGRSPTWILSSLKFCVQKESSLTSLQPVRNSGIDIIIDIVLGIVNKFPGGWYGGNWNELGILESRIRVQINGILGFSSILLDIRYKEGTTFEICMSCRPG